MSKVEKILAFDFDQTINRINLSLRIYVAKLIFKENNSILAKKLLDKLDRTEVLSELFLEPSFIKYLRKLKATGKVKIVISSFGFLEGIKEVLTRYELFDIFDDIYTPIKFGYKDGVQHFEIFRGKNLMIEDVMKRYGVFDRRNVLLLDDSSVNAYYAHLEQIPFILSDKDGLKKNHGKNILKFVRISC